MRAWAAAGIVFLGLAAATFAAPFHIIAEANLTEADQPLLDGLGIALGATLTYEALIEPFPTTPSPTTGNYTYHGAITSLDISIGGASWTETSSTNYFAFDWIGYGDDSSNGSRVIDFFSTDRAVAGPVLGGFESWNASLRLRDFTAAGIAMGPLAAGVLSDEFLTNALAPGGFAEIWMQFYDGTNFARLDAEITSIRVQPVSAVAVPLPAGLPLLFGALASFAFFRRRLR